MENTLKPFIAPSILSADFARLGEECERMISLGAEWLHVDIMDGHFVYNLTIGAPIVKALRDRLGPSAFLDCHLMVSNPTRWLNDLKDAGASQVTLHIETLTETALASLSYEGLNGPAEQAKQNEQLISSPGIGPKTRVFKNALEVVNYIRNDLKLRAGIAVKPGTGLEDVEPLLDHIDMVLIMTVEPGFGGQSFMPHVMPKVERLRQLRPNLDIEVDGGLAPNTIDVAAKAGANCIVAGSAIFKAKDQGAVINQLRDSVKTHLKI